MTERTANEVLDKTRETLATAKLGLADLLGDDPARRLPGLRNLAVFGRSVTLVLQTMRSVDREGFNAWYEPRKAAMMADPLVDYFGELRTEILKEGTPPHGIHAEITVDGSQIAALMSNPPPGATGFFIADRLGSSGWNVELPDGSSATYYVKLPEWLNVRVEMHLPNPPTEHLGQPIADASMENLARLYIAYLERLVADAEAHFS